VASPGGIERRVPAARWRKDAMAKIVQIEGYTRHYSGVIRHTRASPEGEVIAMDANGDDKG
jgi:hypothetical protein